MIKKYLTLGVAFLILNLSFGGAMPAAGQVQEDSKAVRKLKSHLYDLGSGKKVKVVVKLKDGTMMKDCYLSEIAVSYLTVVDIKTGAATDITYEKVQSVKGTKFKFPLVGKILLGVGAAMVLVYILAKNGVLPAE